MAETPLGARERALYVRQITLAEIGSSGQRRLCEARFAAPASPSGRVAALYLRRAGLTEAHTRPAPEAGTDAAGGPDAVGVPVTEVVGVPEAVATWLAGAFASVETIKSVLQVGRPGNIPSSLGASGEHP